MKNTVIETRTPVEIAVNWWLKKMHLAYNKFEAGVRKCLIEMLTDTIKKGFEERGETEISGEFVMKNLVDILSGEGDYAYKVAPSHCYCGPGGRYPDGSYALFTHRNTRWIHNKMWISAEKIEVFTPYLSTQKTIWEASEASV